MLTKCWEVPEKECGASPIAWQTDQRWGIGCTTHYAMHVVLLARANNSVLNLYFSPAAHSLLGSEGYAHLL